LMMIEARGDAPEPPRRGVAAIALGAQARTVLVPIVAELRRKLDVPALMDYEERKLLAHLKIADRNRARFALIVGSQELAAGEIVLRDLENRSDRRVPLSSAGVLAELLVEAGI
jgi:histidyl-tRNA synthetase